MNRDIKCKVSSNNSQWLLKKVAKCDRGLLFFCATLYTQKITYRRNSGLGSCRKCRHRRTTDHCLADEFSLVDTDLQRDRQTDRRTEKQWQRKLFKDIQTLAILFPIKICANRLPVFIISFLPLAILLQKRYVPAHHFLAQPQEQKSFNHL